MQAPQSYVDVGSCSVCGSDRLAPWGKSVADYRLVRCASCGFVCVGHRPTTAAISEYYSSPSQYDGWEAALEPRRQMWANRVELLKAFRLNGSLLDVGTGIGQFLDVVRPFVSRVTGTEVSKSACDVAKRLYGLDVRHGVLEDIVFTERFDIITLFHVLEHVDDPRETLMTSAGLLNDRGMLVIAVPNEVQGLRFKLVRAARRVAPRLIPRPFFTPQIDLTVPDQEIHLNYFTPATAQRLLESCGFEVEAVLLDPYYPVKTSIVSRAKALWYRVAGAFKGATGHVAFDAFMVVARKR